MPSTGRRDLVAKRWEPFVHTIDFVGFDFTGATFLAQVRLFPDAPGVPLVDLATVTTANTQGIRLVGVTTANGIPTSSVYIRINEPVVEGLPFPSEPGADNPLAWDMQIVPSGGDKYRILEGRFIVDSGVTQ